MTALARGKVYLVGAGPGDPALVTVRGLELLGRADVVLHDALAHPALLEACRPDALIRDVGKRYGVDSASQEAITGELIEHARAGKLVVRLKGGDPFVFARGAEEALALARAGVPFEIVPGISSPAATSAYAGISLTHRDLSSSVTFITGSDRAGKEWSPEAWRRLATATDTICVLMGMRRIEEITGALIEGGRSATTPAAVIQWGARPEQRTVTGTLGDIAERVRAATMANPAVIVIGDVVRLRDELRWYDEQPLFGKRVLVARPLAQARETARWVRERGAEPLVVPAIEIVDPPDVEPLRQALSNLARYAWVVFTSANGVTRSLAELGGMGRDARAFSTSKIAAIGPATAEALGAWGLRADVVAEEHVGEALAAAIVEHGGAASRVLVPRALVARDALPEALRAAGCDVDVVAAYATRAVPPERARAAVAAFDDGAIDVVLLTSGSTVSAVCDLLGDRAAELLARTTLASIGPITTRAAAERGLRVDVTATTYTLSGLLDAVEAFFAARS